MYVAPLVGAWIETEHAPQGAVGKDVAPLVGAWIETIVALNDSVQKLSHPSWVRGLKPQIEHGNSNYQ